MATKRSYGEGCAAAHALDLVGERWALLVVRELLLGPKRFTDLRTGLPHASPNVLAQRLRELECNGVVHRRKLGPPYGTWVYELTDWGRELEPVISSLGRWGSRSPTRSLDGDVSVDSLVLALRALFDPSAAPELNATIELRLGDDRFVVAIGDGHLEMMRGEAPDADATIETDASMFANLLTGAETFDDATKSGTLRVSGDEKSARLLFDGLRPPQPAEAAT